MGRGAKQLFEPDRGLQVRMVLTAVLTPLAVAACLLAAWRYAPGKVQIAIGVSLAIGIWLLIYEAVTRLPPFLTTPQDAPELHAIVERLCARADLPKPGIAVRDDDEPNSWTMGLRADRARIHVTTGLRRALDRDELEAVLAHELAHIAHRDAMVMTAVGAPGDALFNGAGRVGQGAPLLLGVGALAAWVVGLVSTLGTASLSRRRELAADATAVALTGRPAALISALQKASGRLALIPREDLREAQQRSAFNLLPVSRSAVALMRTHPPLETRIARLERLERRLHHPAG